MYGQYKRAYPIDMSSCSRGLNRCEFTTFENDILVNQIHHMSVYLLALDYIDSNQLSVKFVVHALCNRRG